MGRYRIRSDRWAMDLPADWVEVGRTGAGEMYYESGDGTKGMYVLDCTVDESTGRTAQEVARTFRTAGLLTLGEMRDYQWELAADESLDEGLAAIAITDAIAHAQGYRIVCKVLARLPMVVRVAFHDYLCSDLDASQRYFAPMLESLRVNELH
ncbi:MAG: hypothetical protein HY854_25150 [Burkholderiales bacterium]|nr:hypothetical protein [Burkholderiales bacterium]